MRTYCFYCDKDVDVTIVECEVESQIDDVKFSYLAIIPYCQMCGEEVYIAKISDRNTRTAHKIYRQLLEKKINYF